MRVGSARLSTGVAESFLKLLHTLLVCLLTHLARLLSLGPGILRLLKSNAKGRGLGLAYTLIVFHYLVRLLMRTALLLDLGLVILRLLNSNA